MNQPRRHTPWIAVLTVVAIVLAGIAYGFYLMGQIP